MRVFLPLCSAFEFFGQAIESRSEVRIDDVGCWARTAISGIDELDGADGAGEPDGREIEHALRIPI